jgi:hypothetical protein
MGFIAKSATKKRIAPLQGPLHPALVDDGQGRWITDFSVPIGVLIRSAVIALDLTGVKSSSLRGTTGRLASALMASASHLWVQMWTRHQWNFVLGVNNGRGGIAADWVVQLDIGATAAAISTSHYLTKDDVLVHGEQHDALRNELLRALSLGGMTDPEGETSLGQTSLGRTQAFAGPPPAAAKVEFSISTRLDPQAIWSHLNLLGHRQLRRTESDGTWALGLPESDSVDGVTLHISPGSLIGEAVIGSEREFARRVAVAGLNSFIGRARFLVGREDPDAQYEGPPEWATGRTQ